VNVQEYISGGIVESYVLGLASDEERREFEQLCTQYPELLQARNDFELSLEKLAMENAIAPAASVKITILEEIRKEAKVVSMNPTATVKKINWYKYAAAACVLLLAGSAYLNITLNNKNKKLRGDYSNTMAELSSMKKDVEMLTGGDPDVKMASMKGLDISPQSFATVYWDSTSKDVYLLVNNLPKPADTMQYQLWALADGQPVDLGFIQDEYFIKKNKLLIKGKNAQHAQAFAITLEKKGRPDASKPAGNMYVMGGL
jgi:anti-sigma-K factor RskA